MFVKLIEINTVQWGSIVDRHTLERYAIAIATMKMDSAHSIGVGSIVAASKKNSPI